VVGPYGRPVSTARRIRVGPLFDSSRAGRRIRRIANATKRIRRIVNAAKRIRRIVNVV